MLYVIYMVHADCSFVFMQIVLSIASHCCCSVLLHLPHGTGVFIYKYFVLHIQLYVYPSVLLA